MESKTPRMDAYLRANPTITPAAIVMFHLHRDIAALEARHDGDDVDECEGTCWPSLSEAALKELYENANRLRAEVDKLQADLAYAREELVTAKDDIRALIKELADDEKENAELLERLDIANETYLKSIGVTDAENARLQTENAELRANLAKTWERTREAEHQVDKLRAQVDTLEVQAAQREAKLATMVCGTCFGDGETRDGFSDSLIPCPVCQPKERARLDKMVCGTCKGALVCVVENKQTGVMDGIWCPVCQPKKGT